MGWTAGFRKRVYLKKPYLFVTQLVFFFRIQSEAWAGHMGLSFIGLGDGIHGVGSSFGVGIRALL